MNEGLNDEELKDKELNNKELKDKQETVYTIKPGMRVIKTVLASFICMIIDYFRGEIPFQTVITTAICIQPETEDTISSGVMRTIGTMIGALFGSLVIFVFDFFNIEINTLIYYFIISFLMIPLIMILGLLKSPKGVIVSIVLFLSITLNENASDTRWIFIFNRVLDTLIGIFVALPVNILLPHKYKNEECNKKFDISKISALDIREIIKNRKDKKRK